MKKIKAITSTVALGFLGYMGAVEGNAMAWNLYRFVLALAVITMMHISNTPKSEAKLLQTYRDGRHLPEWMDVAFYFALVAVLVAKGHFFWGVIQMVSGTYDLSMRAKSKQTAAI